MSAPLLEKDISKACVQWLNSIPGVTVWRQNTGKVLQAYKSKRTGIETKRLLRFGEVGQGDHSGLMGPRGTRLEVEIKRPPEVPSLEQETWMAMINDRHGVAFWTDGLDDCVRKFRAIWIARAAELGLEPWRKSWEV
jgi:hypothetical protein